MHTGIGSVSVGFLSAWFLMERAKVINRIKSVVFKAFDVKALSFPVHSRFQDVAYCRLVPPPLPLPCVSFLDICTVC